VLGSHSEFISISILLSENYSQMIFATYSPANAIRVNSCNCAVHHHWNAEK